MMRHWAIYIYLLAVAWSAVGCSPQANTHQQMDAFVDSLRIAGDTPGMAVTVWHNGRIIYSKGFGFADLEAQTPVSPSSTKFRIGSVSKSFTAAALGILMDKGRLNPDTTIQTYVPYFPVKRWPVTVRQVAGHIAGIRHYRGAETFSTKPYHTVKEGLGIFLKRLRMRLMSWYGKKPRGCYVY